MIKRKLLFLASMLLVIFGLQGQDLKLEIQNKQYLTGGSISSGSPVKIESGKSVEITFAIDLTNKNGLSGKVNVYTVSTFGGANEKQPEEFTVFSGTKSIIFSAGLRLDSRNFNTTGGEFYVEFTGVGGKRLRTVGHPIEVTPAISQPVVGPISFTNNVIAVNQTVDNGSLSASIGGKAVLISNAGLLFDTPQYYWEKQYIFPANSPWEKIPNSNSLNYLPESTKSARYRRVFRALYFTKLPKTSNNFDSRKIFSNVVAIYVPENTIELVDAEDNPDRIFYKGETYTLKGLDGYSDGNFPFPGGPVIKGLPLVSENPFDRKPRKWGGKWEQSFDEGENWNEIPMNIIISGFTLNADVKTSIKGPLNAIFNSSGETKISYRRIIFLKDNPSVETVSNVVNVTHNKDFRKAPDNEITANLIEGEQYLLEGNVPKKLEGNNVISNFDDVFYLWQSKVIGEKWINAKGDHIGTDFLPSQRATKTTMYRRKALSFLGNLGPLSLSNEITINVLGKDEFVKVFPNPVRKGRMLTFEINVKGDQDIEIKLVKIFGNEYSVFKERVKEGLQTIEWLVPSELDGSYIYNINTSIGSTSGLISVTN